MNYVGWYETWFDRPSFAPCQYGGPTRDPGVRFASAARAVVILGVRIGRCCMLSCRRGSGAIGRVAVFLTVNLWFDG